jgi:SAM-dependent methyltransferase
VRHGSGTFRGSTAKSKPVSQRSFKVDLRDSVPHLPRMFGFRARRREDALKKRLAARDERISTLKDRISAVKAQRDEARSKAAEFSVELAEQQRLRGDAEARVARLMEDLKLAEANPLPSGLAWPIPPIMLRARVAGSWAGHSFLRMAGLFSDDIRSLLDLAGEDRYRFLQVLDWGCGCGRLTRVLSDVFPNACLMGADIDAEAIAWNCEHLAGLASFHVVPSVPPSTLPAAHFDMILGISVFTHLPLELEKAWLRELARIAAPNCRLLLSYHGDDLIREHFTMDQAIENESGFSYFRTSSTEGLPDHYQASFHSEDALRSLCGVHFDILSIHPRALGRRQGFVLCQPRSLQ